MTTGTGGKPHPVAKSHRFRRNVLRGLAALALVVTTAIGAVWGTAQWRLNAPRQAELIPLKVQPSPALVAEGERAFHIFGCAGCHHDAGNVLFEAPQVGRLIAPNISRRVADYSDEALVRLIRRGVKHDGTTAIVMPSSELGRISDQDVAAIVSYIRSQPPRPDAVTVSTRWGPLGYLALAAGKVDLSAEIAPDEEPPVMRPLDSEGEYLVGAICRACHELDSAYDNGFGMKTPPLRAMAKGYSLNEFRHLMRTGEGSGGRALGLMSVVAKSDFSHFTDGEIDAVHAYLTAP
jgi:mono/diheme cytochrome c family protein